MDKNLAKEEVVLSVIMPVYNSAKYLRKAIDSILNQTFQEFEFLIFDDGSTDESVDIIKSYTDKRIIAYYAKQNIGHVKHLNTGIKNARGKYIARMDSDDISLPNRFAKQLDCFLKNPKIGIVFTRTMMIDDKGENVCESWRPKKLSNILRFLPYRTYIPHPSVMIKRDLYIKYNLYKPERFPIEDMDLWSRFYLGGEKFYYIKEILLLYRLNPQSVQNVKGNAAYQPNYYFKLALDCFANNAKLKALVYAKKYWISYSFKQKLIFLVKLITPFYFLVLRGYIVSRISLTK